MMMGEFQKVQYAAYKRQRRRAFIREVKETIPDIIAGFMIMFMTVLLWIIF